VSLLRTVFLTRHNDLRTVWRMLAFVTVAGTAGLGLTLLARAAAPGEVYAQMLAAIAAVALATLVLTRLAHRKPFTAVGLSLHPPVWRELGMGILIGFLMMAGIFLVLFALGDLTLTGRGLAPAEVGGVLLRAVLLFGLGAFFEEFTFRGYLFQTLMQGVTFLPATILFAIFFSAAHAWNPHTAPLAMANIALASILLSFAYMKTRRLWLPFGIHFSWNFAQTTIFGLPTSGHEFAGRAIVQAVASGPEWLTGGAFGPEGGALATLALLLATGHVIKSDLYRPPPAVVTLDSLEDLLPPPAAEGQTR
jgi:hypothetical protein